MLEAEHFRAPEIREKQKAVDLAFSGQVTSPRMWLGPAVSYCFCSVLAWFSLTDADLALF
jgi:hypothetical protein